ncbi:MAG: PCYCGC domain-containing protein [Exiguobacterium oxidotolerans]|uniref:PCYCGC domain-containing protein n=1 Tax=Exiguobacterium sp. s133 TaxID=2751213 RepID=UPI001BEA221F|nr:PCYCGC domain-containing protein [Exiguobacterium sp. s133]
MKRQVRWFTLTLTASLALGACAPAEQHTDKQMSTEHAEHETHGAGDQLEKTSAKTIAPAFLKETDESIQTIYLAVAKHQDLLEKMPCYCGCGETAGHTSNYDCFIADQTAAGETTWTTHGITCGTCLDIAAQSIVAYQQGTPIKKIRQDIDAAYATTGVAPTKTPAL